MELRGIESAVVPSELPLDHLAKDTKALVCPFCGSKFEIAQYDAGSENRNVKHWERDNMICASLKTETPVVLRCKECGIEIHNLLLCGWFYGEQVKE